MPRWGHDAVSREGELTRAHAHLPDHGDARLRAAELAPWLTSMPATRPASRDRAVHSRGTDRVLHTHSYRTPCPLHQWERCEASRGQRCRGYESWEQTSPGEYAPRPSMQEQTSRSALDGGYPGLWRVGGSRCRDGGGIRRERLHRGRADQRSAGLGRKDGLAGLRPTEYLPVQWRSGPGHPPELAGTAVRRSLGHVDGRCGWRRCRCRGRCRGRGGAGARGETNRHEDEDEAMHGTEDLVERWAWGHLANGRARFPLHQCPLPFDASRRAAQADHCAMSSATSSAKAKLHVNAGETALSTCTDRSSPS